MTENRLKSQNVRRSKTLSEKEAKRRERNRRYYLKRKTVSARKVVLNVVAKKVAGGRSLESALADSASDSPLFAYEARSYRGIVAAIVKKREALGLTQAEVDELAGLQSGYCGKCEKPSTSYGRIMGDMAFPVLLATLGLTIVITDIGYAKKAIDHAKVGARRRGAQKKGRRK